MTSEGKPPLVAAVEAALGTKVVALRYLPAPSVAAAALAETSSGHADAAEPAPEGDPPGANAS